MKRVYNFNVGPACLPMEVLQQAHEDFFNFRGTGMSVMEMSHRSTVFEELVREAESDLRELMAIPADYSVIFMQGGASTQFALVPMNLMQRHKAAYYAVTGVWAQKAAAQARYFGEVLIAANGEKNNFMKIPAMPAGTFSRPADYVHVTQNNTTCCTRLTSLPDTGGIPIAADMSSCILSEPFRVQDYGLIYACAQKNLGPAGLTVVIVRKDLPGGKPLPAMFDYKLLAENGSLYNTPPTYALYMAGLVLQWLKKKGGVSAIYEENVRKAKLLYDCIDASSLFSCPVEPRDRSLMNVAFLTGDAKTDDRFIEQAALNGIVNIRANPSIGGMRASIYNPMTLDGVRALTDFMREFERRA